MSATTDLIGRTVNCPSCTVSLTVESPESKAPTSPTSLSGKRADHYLVLVGSEQRGPYTLSQLRSMWGSGAITADALYWQKGLDKWEPISRISDLLDPPTPAVQHPAPQVSSRLSAKQQVIIRSYQGSQEQAWSEFQGDAKRMAAQGYVPISQTWTPGEYGCGSFLAALLLCVILIGFLIFIYMLIVKPPGTLTVNYALQ
ncbi:MAG: DUF4339 domain-containing protein [Chthoniobacteraceae bacterium]